MNSECELAFSKIEKNNRALIISRRTSIQRKKIQLKASANSAAGYFCNEQSLF